MDKKYVGKVINLPIDAHNALVEVQKEVAEKIGFEPSLSETVAYLVKYYRQN